MSTMLCFLTENTPSHTEKENLKKLWQYSNDVSIQYLKGLKANTLF